ncbi:hypothetical protein HALDL1_05195 [Halobacterium sp. DL1]|nr:hypothetical protein HALDL1_05195 [Halobacterium sp. DL1]
MSRAQANLPALVVALLLVTTSVGVTVGLAASAFAGADADPADARLAGSLSERLVAADGPLSVRANVLSRAAVENASSDSLPENASIRVRLGGDPILEQGDPDGGATMQRIVLVVDAERRTFEPALTGRDAVTLPRRTSNATLTIDPRPGASVTAVRANDRVVLHDPGGLDGTYDIALARYDTVELSFDASRDLVAGSVTVTYRVETTTKAVLEVTADA